ncbi:DNA polymerase subunit beta [Nocardioides gansuensis]|uniref:DNA polymerase subunit beta n=1 Tax=Nocardioides gansuensis TaxID=2138300 RepID=A0A2T8F8A0_9ACTN|nr:nucleotidyltransferase domain-containing protein [Nocardioides gansuensis]PVG81887.1 DNA polymerase subunit beta [Nocardioides gansuensis]
MISDEALQELAGQLIKIAGIQAVTLRGSRARGAHTPESDVDLGLYYRPPLDVDALGQLARRRAGDEARVTVPGEWGPWVDGGAWLDLDGTAVDWIYRDIDRVRMSWRDAEHGRFRFHCQAGHPLGVPDFAYAGEVALARILADASGELTALQQETRTYPPQLRETLVAQLWEASFALENARKAVTRADSAYVAGCLFRIVLLCAHALHADAGRWLINEKGAVASVGDLPHAPAGFSQRAHRLCGHIGKTAAELRATLSAAQDLLDDTRAACRSG